MAVDFGKTTDRLSRILRYAKTAAFIVCMTQINHPIEAMGQTPAASYHVTLGWDAHEDTQVTGYRVHYGVASGVYTASIAVGNVTQTTIPGLASGVNHFFSVTALHTSGLESDYSNEVNFLPGKHATSLRPSDTGEMVLTVRGVIGLQYDIEASQDLNTWTLISTVTIQDGGSLQFSDPDAASYPTRFYRTRESP